jgi:hypothetical protein
MAEACSGIDSQIEIQKSGGAENGKTEKADCSFLDSDATPWNSLRLLQDYPTEDISSQGPSG